MANLLSMSWILSGSLVLWGKNKLWHNGCHYIQWFIAQKLAILASPFYCTCSIWQNAHKNNEQESDKMAKLTAHKYVVGWKFLLNSYEKWEGLHRKVGVSSSPKVKWWGIHWRFHWHSVCVVPTSLLPGALYKECRISVLPVPDCTWMQQTQLNQQAWKCLLKAFHPGGSSLLMSWTGASDQMSLGTTGCWTGNRELTPDKPTIQ